MNQQEAEACIQKKIDIESNFKTYIQSMNEAATHILRDYEESVKVKEICKIMQSKSRLGRGLN